MASHSVTSVTDLLIHGRAEIVRRGWRQGNWSLGRFGHNPGVCLMDAIWSGTNGEAPYCEAQALLAEAAGETSSVGALDWNDAPGRTKEEVLAVYDKAIEKARSMNEKRV